MTSPARQDRVITWIIIASAIICCLTLATAAAALPILIDARGSIQAQQRSDEISACRSEVRSDLDLATAAVEDLIFDGLTAVALADEAAVRAVAERAPDTRIERDLAVLAVGRAADLSARDPAAFLEWCAER